MGSSWEEKQRLCKKKQRKKERKVCERIGKGGIGGCLVGVWWVLVGIRVFVWGSVEDLPGCFVIS